MNSLQEPFFLSTVFLMTCSVEKTLEKKVYMTYLGVKQSEKPAQFYSLASISVQCRGNQCMYSTYMSYMYY